MSLLHEALVGARFLTRLPRFLRRPPDPAQARRTLDARLRDREASFVALVRRGVYGNPRSPYRASSSPPPAARRATWPPSCNATGSKGPWSASSARDST